jgi:hypothetical protein
MAKTVKNEPRGQVKKASSGFSFDSLPSKYVIPGVILTIIVLFLIFLNPLFFGGKLFQSGDIVASESMQPYLHKIRDGFTLWNPHIFCGMPAYSIAVGYTWFNLIYVALTVVRSIFMAPFSVDYVCWAFYLIVFAITSFFLMKHLTKNVLVSLFTALASSFSTGIIVFLYIGHVTKLTSLCMFPLIFLLLLRMQQKIKLLDIFLLIISLQLLVQGFHLQIIFYLILATAIYFIYYLIFSFVKSDKRLTNQLLKSGGLLVFAIGIALLIQLDNFSQIYEYTPYSTRGTKGIKELTQSAASGTTTTTAVAESDSAQSAYYSYHTDWSFSPGEVITFVIPSFYGFGNSTYVEPGSSQEIDVNTYFGQMPFVDVAMYMGVLVFFLALYGAFTRFKTPLVQFLVILGIFALLLSFGKNLPFLFNLLFYHMPYFDKFRVPSMALVLVQFVTPILAGFGLHEIISPAQHGENNAKAGNTLRTIAIVFSALFVLSLVAQSSLADSFFERAMQAKGDNPQMARMFQALQDHMKSMYIGDLLAAFGLSALLFWGGFLVRIKKLSPTLFATLAIVLLLIDLWRIDARGAKYVDAPDKKEMFTEPEYVKIIKAQGDKEPFRILNLKQRGPGSINENSNYHAYFLLEDFYGYSAVKPRAFQDMMDVVGIFSPAMWKMANVKYLILDRPYTDSLFTMIGGSGDSYVFKLNNQLNRYYFVNRVEQKPAVDVLNDLKAGKFDPADVAYVQEAPPAVQKPDSTAKITLQKYTDEVTLLDVTASGNNFIVFASSYQPKGWHAYVDGNQVTLYRADHAFMGIVVPQGKHTVEFRYAPESFAIAKNVALILSTLVILGLLFSIYKEIKERRSLASPVPEKAAEA